MMFRAMVSTCTHEVRAIFSRLSESHDACNRPLGRIAALGHGRPIRLGNWHARSYLNCGCAKTRVRHSGLGPLPDSRIAANRPLDDGS